MRRLFAITLAGAIATTAMLTLPAATELTAQAMPKRCGNATRVGGAEGAAMPVLFVHGFSGSLHDFSHCRSGAPSMLQAVGALSGVTAYTFDYSRRASRWVTDQGIGPALAQSIRCLAVASGRRVMMVAHSMGGLATRFAQGQVIDGRAVSESLARVVTVGTRRRAVSSCCRSRTAAIPTGSCRPPCASRCVRR